MATSKRVLAWALAFVFLAVNLLTAIPQTALAAAGLTFDSKISDFDGTQEEVLAKLKSYKTAEFQVGDGFGINGTRGAYMKTTTSDEHRVQGSEKFALKQGKTYYISTWVKTPTVDTGFALRTYFQGYHLDVTVNGSDNRWKQSGIYSNPKAAAVVGEWQQYTLSFTVNKVYKSYKVGTDTYYVEIPANADGTYPAGTAAGTNESDGVFTPTSGNVTFDVFLAIGCYTGTSWSNAKQINPTELYVDGWYVLEEDSDSSVNYARAMVTNAEIANENGQAVASSGTVLTVSADSVNANPKAENTVTYQWQSSDNGTDYTNISGETGASYTVKTGDAEKWIRAVVTAESAGTVNGTTTMSAVSNAIEIPDAITAAVADVNVEAATSVLKIDESAQLNAKAVDASGNQVEGAVVSYTSSDEDVAVIQDGQVVAKREGMTTITASAGNCSKSYILVVYSNVIKEQKFETNTGLTKAAFADKTSIVSENSADVYAGEGSRTGTGNYFATNQESIVLTEVEVDGSKYSMGTSSKRYSIGVLNGAESGTNYGTIKERGILQLWFYDDYEDGANASNKGKQISFEFMGFGGKGDYKDENGALYPKFPNGTENTGDTNGNGWTHAFRAYFRLDDANKQYRMTQDSSVFGSFTKDQNAPARSKGWHQLIVDYTKDNEYSFYVDGELAFSRNTGDLPSNGGINVVKVDRHGISLAENDANHYIRISDLAKYDVTVTANYNIAINVGENGSVKVGDTTYAGGTTGTANVAWGQDLSMTITPAEDYLIDTVMVDGRAAEVGADNVLTLTNIKADAQVSVTFKPAASVSRYDFSVNVSGRGSVTVNGTPIEETYSVTGAYEGTKYDLTVTPDSGYIVSSVKVNDVETALTDDGKLSVTLSENTAVAISFAKEPRLTMSSISLSENTSFYQTALPETELKVWGYAEDGQKRDLTGNAFVSYESSAPWIFQFSGNKISSGSSAGSALITATYVNPDGSKVTGSIWMTRTEQAPVTYGFSTGDTPESYRLSDGEMKGHDGNSVLAYYKKDVSYGNNYSLRTYVGRQEGDKNWYTRGLRAVQGWFYDDGENNAGFYVQLCDNNLYNTTDFNTNFLTSDAHNYWTATKYPVGAFQNASYYVSKNEVTNVPRTVGWHQVMAMLDADNKQLVFYIDGIQVGVEAIVSSTQTSERRGDSCIELRSTQGEAATVQSNVTYTTEYYFDDLAMYDLPESEAPAMAPVVTSVFVDGVAMVGYPVKVTYEIKDYNDDELDDADIQWQVSDDGVNSWTDISGATNETYIIGAEQQGKYLRAAVTPHAKVEPTTGETAYSAPTEQVSETKLPPSASQVKISGDVELGGIVTASYTYVKSEGGDGEGASEIIWEAADSINGAFTQIGTGASFVINASVAGKYLRVIVVPADSNGLQGDAVASSAVKVPGGVSYYVSLDGNDSNPGTLEEPFRTVEAARDALRGSEVPDGGATVYIREGTYYLTNSFALTSSDSGREGAPIVYRPYGDEKVVFHGGFDLDVSKFSNVSGEMKDLLPAESQNKVLVADLSDLGISNISKYSILSNSGGLNAPIISLDGKAMHVARYPNTRDNSQWPTIYCAPGEAGYEGTNLGNKETDDKQSFTVQYKDDTAARVNGWTYGLDSIAAEGFWKFDWYASTTYVTIDKEKKQITAVSPDGKDSSTHYGVYLKQDRVFCFKNVYQELDEAGEYYIDFDTQKIYIYPFEGVTAQSSMKMTNLAKNLIEMNNVSYVTIQGIELTSGKSKAINASGCTGVVIDDCYINGFQGNAINMSGYNNMISNNDIEFCGTGAVTISGGDKANLTPGNNKVENNKINDFALLKTIYSPGVSVDGVGNYVSHNEVYNAEHYAIYFAGVENIIEYNDIHNACTNAADMGSIYTGRHFDDHGVVIRYNHFHDIGNPLSRRFFPCAIFTDDGSSDLDIYGNVFGTGIATTETIKIHGGQNNNTYHNLFIDAPVVLYSAEWPDSKWRDSLSDSEGKYYNVDQYWNRFNSVRNNPLYREKWPWLAEASDAYDAGNMSTVVHHSNMLAENLIIYVNEEPEEFVRNGSNLLQATKGWWRAYGYHAIIGTNDKGGNTNVLLTNENGNNKEYFTDFDNGNYRLTDESLYDLFDQFDILGEFVPIPFDEIGMYAKESNEPPVALSVSINSSSDTQVNGLYEYRDPERDPEGNSTFRWLVSDTIDGTYSAISGATEKTFTVTNEYSGKFLKFEVTPVSLNGDEGYAVLSSAFAVAADKDALNQIIGAVEAAISKAVIGTALGNYTQENVTILNSAVQAAKDVAATEDASAAEVSKAASDLSDAYAAFQKTANNTETTANQETVVTSGLTNVEITFTGGQNEYTVTFADAAAPATKITAGGVTVTVEQGTVIPGGKLKITLPQQPSIQLFGDIASLVKVGETGDVYTKPIRIELAGNVSRDIVRIGTETYEKITKILNEDLASALTTANYGKYGASDSTVAVWTKLGGEYAAATLITPSAEAQLKELQINGKNYVKFNPATTSYRYALPAGTTNLPVVTAQAKDDKATVTVDQVTALPGTATVTVRAENLETTAVYTIEFFVMPSDDSSDDNNNNSNVPSTPSTPSNPVGPSITTNVNTGNPTSSFTDIIGHWAEADINAMHNKGIVSGVTETTFEPDRNITRAEFATLIVKGLGLQSNVSAGFKDTDPYEWYYNYVNAAAAVGLITGYDGYFRPNDNITREEMAVIIAKAYAFNGNHPQTGGMIKFTDAGEVSDWAYDSVDQAAAAGLISGKTESTFQPKDNATRAECASLLKRLLDQ